ncbi:hypothetical protein glysoja_008231 [Glycine soja]|nr:hypothetical protein glysoja_008231 [Glycine soja]
MPITQSQQAGNDLHNNMNAGKVQKRKAPAKPAKPAHVKPAKPTPVSVKIAKAAPVKTAKPAPIKNAKLAAATSPVGHYTKMSYGIAKSANTGDKEKYDAKVQKKAQGLKPPRPVTKSSATTTKESLSQEVNSPTLGLQKTPKK